MGQRDGVSIRLFNLTGCSRDSSMDQRLARAMAVYWGLAVVPFVPNDVGFHILPALDERALEDDDDAIYVRVTSDIQRVLEAPQTNERARPSSVLSQK